MCLCRESTVFYSGRVWETQTAKDKKNKKYNKTCNKTIKDGSHIAHVQQPQFKGKLLLLSTIMGCILNGDAITKL